MPVVRRSPFVPVPPKHAEERDDKRIERDDGGAAPADIAGDAFAHVKRDPDVAVAFVQRFDAELGLSKKLVREKEAHMASSGQHLLTAMPALFYKDVRGPFALAAKWRESKAPTGVLVGDAHLGNTATRTGPNGDTVWGFTDCDKSGRGPFEWDLDRLATHALLVAREAHKSLSSDDERAIVDAIADGYTKTMRAFATSGARPPGFLNASECKDDELAHFVHHMGGESEKKFIKHKCPHGDFDKDVRANAVDDGAIRSAIADWSSRLPNDANIKRPVEVLATAALAPQYGGSSAGIVKYLALLAPADGKTPVLVRLKPVLPSAPDDGSGKLANADAAKVVAATATLQGFRDPLLGYAKVHGMSCVVEPERANWDIYGFEDVGRKELAKLGHDAGVALARSQLQSREITPGAIATWLGDPKTDGDASAKLLRFARDYADQTERDRKALGHSL